EAVAGTEMTAQPFGIAHASVEPPVSVHVGQLDQGVVGPLGPEDRFAEAGAVATPTREPVAFAGADVGATVAIEIGHADRRSAPDIVEALERRPRNRAGRSVIAAEQAGERSSDVGARIGTPIAVGVRLGARRQNRAAQRDLFALTDLTA